MAVSVVVALPHATDGAPLRPHAARGRGDGHHPSGRNPDRPDDMDRRLSPPVEGDADPGSAVDGGENTSEVRGGVR
jgi:hypothetical protein